MLDSFNPFYVAPFAGAWIEMDCARKARSEALKSLPSRERGLKYVDFPEVYAHTESLPSRERGLKYNLIYALYDDVAVAPFAGAWIEMP